MSSRWRVAGLLLAGGWLAVLPLSGPAPSAAQVCHHHDAPAGHPVSAPAPVPHSPCLCLSMTCRAFVVVAPVAPVAPPAVAAPLVASAPVVRLAPAVVPRILSLADPPESPPPKAR